MSQPQYSLRRSVRKSASATPQVAPSVAEQSVAASTTAGTRRKGALPKTKARKSQAYGSGNPADAAEQLDVSSTGFTQAFDNTRTGAVARGDNTPEDRVDDSKSYGALRETGLLSGHATLPNGNFATQEPSQEPVNEFAGDAEPGQRAGFRRFLGETANQYIDNHAAATINNALWIAFSTIIVIAFFRSIGLKSDSPYMNGTNTTSATATGVSLSDALSSRVAYIRDGVGHWISPPRAPDVHYLSICEHPSVECDERGMPSLTFDDLSTRMFNLEWEQRISKEAYKRVLQEHKQSQQEHKQSQQEHKQSQQEHKQSQQELKQSLQEYKRLTTEIKDIQDAIHLYTVTHNKEGQVKIPDAELKVNYFSTGLGARIDVLATSSTRRGNDGFLASIYRSLFSIPGRRPPITALQAWKEPGDCWCAAATDPERIGRAQLAVVLAFPVFPTQVTVEHLRSDAAPGKKVPTAPKSMELWVKTSEPLQRQSLSCLGDGPKGYVCLGTFEYNILGSNNVQTFDLERMSVVPVTRAILRVTSTWGSDNACLYRVRLHGDSPDVPNEDGSGDW